MLDFDAFGNQRWVTRGLEEELPSACTRKKRRGLRRAFEDVKITKANEALHGVLDYLFLSSPFVVKYMTDLTNWAVDEWSPRAFPAQFRAPALQGRYRIPCQEFERLMDRCL